MNEQHREEQRSTLEWLRGWGQIKVQGTDKRRGWYVPKRPQIVSTTETTLQEALRPSGYTALSKETMMAVVARRSGRAQEGEDTGADENRRGHGSLGTKRSGDARAMQARCKGATPAMCGGPRGPYPGSHTDQELT